jgi:hypothetical protein
MATRSQPAAMSILTTAMPRRSMNTRSSAMSPADSTFPTPFSTATSMYAFAFSLMSAGTGT